MSAPWETETRPAITEGNIRRLGFTADYTVGHMSEGNAADVNTVTDGKI